MSVAKFRRWGNWAGTVLSRPLAVHIPRDEAQLTAILGAAAARGERVRAVGAGHSCAPVADPDGAHLIYLSSFNRVLSVDRTSSRVTVQAGMSLAQLNAVLAAEGLALPSLGSISAQSIAGLISTGTHGTGLHSGGIAESVAGLRLITAAGKQVEIGDDEPDLLRAARVSMGMLGVITAVTFTCRPAFTLELIQRPASLAESLKNIDRLMLADHFGIWWFPHLDKVALRSFRECNDPHTAVPSPLQSRWRAQLVGNGGYAARLLAAASYPSITPRANAWMFKTFFAREKRQVGPSYRVFGIDAPLRHTVIEYAVPLERSREAITRLQALLNGGPDFCHAPIDVRFTAPDESWLSPAYRQATCWIGPMIYRPFGHQLPFERLFRRVDALFAEMDGRPHWAKFHYRSRTELGALYPRWADFLNLRRQFDPNGMFLNYYLARFFA